MPQIFRMGEYWIYFWTMVEARSTDIIQKWFTYFGEINTVVSNAPK